MVASKSIAVLGSLACAGFASAYTSYNFSGNINFTVQSGWINGDAVSGTLAVNTVTNPVSLGANNESYTLTGTLTLQDLTHPQSLTFNLTTAGVQDAGAPPSLLTWTGVTSGNTFNCLMAMRGGPGAQPDLSYPDPINFANFNLGTTLDVNQGTGASTQTQSTITSFQAVPEPASMAAMGLGIVGLTLKRRKRTA